MTQITPWSQLPKLKRQILQVMPKGRDNARPAASLVEEIDLDEQDPTERRLRKHIQELVVDHEKPIGSCHDGYFRIETEEELNEYLEDLEARKAGIEKQIRAMRNAFYADDEPQPSLFR